VPACNVAGARGSIAKANAREYVRLVLIAVQVTPPLVLLYTPCPPVAEYTVFGLIGSIATARISILGGPLLTVQLTPPSVLLTRPDSSVPAYKVVDVAGSIAKE